MWPQRERETEATISTTGSNTKNPKQHVACILLQVAATRRLSEWADFFAEDKNLLLVFVE